MELRHLRYLVAVAEEQSFLRAAQRLRVAQSALSKQIQDLEREIGVALFHRVPRGVRLTPGGEAFVREARNTLANAERAVRAAQAAEDAGEAVLRFGHGALGARAPFVLQLMTTFRRMYPGTEIAVHHLEEAEQHKAVMDGTIDLAVTYIAESPNNGMASVLLMDCACDGVLLPADHPLAQNERVHLRELADLTYLSPSTQHWPRLCRAIFNAFAERGLTVSRTRAMKPDTHTGIMEVAVGGGWVLANDAYEAVYRTITPDIVFRRFYDAPIPVHLGLIWNEQTTSRWVQPMVDLARQSSPLAMAMG
jgi:DNA-binding transcriptional LysR family regulator